jgi:CBS domain-containing protein
MVELVDQLITDPDILPCEAAETISIQRISSSERTHTAADIMESAISVSASCTIQDAASLLIETGTSLLTVLDPFEFIVGVVTQWDITRATANGLEASREISEIMTRQVISAAPSDSLVEVVRKLEYHEISAIPVVQDSKVLGIVSTDLLARRSLLPLLVKQDH